MTMAPPFKAVPASIFAEYLAGSTIEEIAASTGLNYATVRRRLLAFGIELRKRGSRPTNPLSRFEALSSPEPNSGCWLWAGCAGEANGYGYFSLKRSDGAILAHRASYEIYVGPIADGLHIDHLCRNRICVNPAHLEPVTQAENNRRAMLARKGA